MRLLSILVVTLALLFTVLFTACATHKPVQPVGPPPLTDQDIEHQIFDAINSQRATSGLPPFAMSPELASSAQAHSERMLDGNFLSTRGPGEPSVVIRMTSTGIKTQRLGEDVIRVRIARDQLAKETVDIWMGTPADQKNVLSPSFTKVGIGMAHATDDSDYYITADFAK